MRDYNYIDDVEVLKDNILDEDCKIIYMKQKAEDYFIHIICCQFTDVESLKMNWKELVNNVSEVVQKRLNDLIEIYNVYIVFFQPQVEDSVVYNIEQNKYSSRKIVLRKEMPDDKTKLEQIISSKLFDLKIEKENSEQCCFTDSMDFITSFNDENCEKGLEKYIEECAWEAMNEKN